MRGLAIGIDVLGVFIAQFIKAELAPVRHIARGSNRMGPAGEQALHFGRAFEVPLGIGVEQMAGPRHGGLVPDRGHHVLQRPAFGRVIVDIIGGQQAEAMGAGKAVQSRNPGNIIAAIEVGCGNVAQGG